MTFLMCSQVAPKLQVIKNHIWSRRLCAQAQEVTGSVTRAPGGYLVGTWQAPGRHLLSTCRTPVRNLSVPVWHLASTWLALLLPRPLTDHPSVFVRCEDLMAGGRGGRHFCISFLK